MTEDVPLRRLVLYKHGISYLTRRGRVSGRDVSLRLRAGDVDDVLKTLLVMTLDGGAVTGIRYGTPRDRAARLGEAPFHPGRRHSLFDLLRDLRGVPVALHLEGNRSVRGRIVGIEEHPQGREHSASLVLMIGEGTLEQIASDRIRGLEVEDERIAADLALFLDAYAAEDTQRTVQVTFSEPDHEVEMSYAIPSPLWRVSYRLVADRSSGEALLQGWGILDNPFDEDLEDVEIALVAGRPVSFRYDLTSSVVPEREVVREASHAPSGPVEVEPALYEAAAMPRAAAPMMMRSIHHMAQSQVVAAESEDLDEMFEYRLSGVTIRRGESAMLPILQQRGPYRRELLYKSGAGERHPVVTLRYERVDLTLERGPLTIVEEGQYRGEAILPFTRAGDEIALAYAREPGITVWERVDDHRTIAGLHLEGLYAHLQEYLTVERRYRLVNRTEREQIVTVEQPRGDGDLVDTRPPDERTSSSHRWRVSCAPQAETEIAVFERQLISSRYSVLDVQLDLLARWLDGRFLDPETRRELQGLLRDRQAIEVLDRQMEHLRAERDDLARRQDRLRQNLGITPGDDVEAEIRRRSAEEFRRTQDRESEIGAEMSRLSEERAALQRRFEFDLAGLGSDD